MNNRFNYSLFIAIVVVFAVLGSFLFIAPAASSAESERRLNVQAMSAEFIRVSD